MFKTAEHEERFVNFLEQHHEAAFNPKQIAYLYVIASLPIDLKIMNQYIKAPTDLSAYQIQIHELALNLLGDKAQNCELNDLLMLEPEDLKMMLNAITIAANKVTFILSDQGIQYYKGI